MALDCLADFGRKFLIGLNTVFLLLALAVTVIGALVKYGKNVMGSILETILGGITSMASSTGLGNFDLSNIDIGAMVGGAAVGFIIAGAVLMAVAAFGMYGAKKKLRFSLIMYTVIIVAIMASEIAFVIVVITMRQKIDVVVKGPMKSMLTTQYVGINGSDVVSLTWNFLMISLSCCGVDSFSDFNNSATWERDYTTVDNSTLSVVIPISCCKNPDAVHDDHGCLINPDAKNSNYMKGCYDALWEEINNNSALMIGVLSTVAVFEISLIFFAAWVSRGITKEQKEQDETEEDENTEENQEESSAEKPKKVSTPVTKTQTKTSKSVNENSTLNQLVTALSKLVIQQPQTATLQTSLPWQQDAVVQNTTASSTPLQSLVQACGNLQNIGLSGMPQVQGYPNFTQPFSGLPVAQTNPPYLGNQIQPAQLLPQHLNPNGSRMQGIVDISGLILQPHNQILSRGQSFEQPFFNNMSPPPYSGHCRDPFMKCDHGVSQHTFHPAEIELGLIDHCSCGPNGSCKGADDRIHAIERIAKERAHATNEIERNSKEHGAHSTNENDRITKKHANSTNENERMAKEGENSTSRNEKGADSPQIPTGNETTSRKIVDGYIEDTPDVIGEFSSENVELGIMPDNKNEVVNGRKRAFSATDQSGATYRQNKYDSDKAYKGRSRKKIRDIAKDSTYSQSFG